MTIAYSGKFNQGENYFAWAVVSDAILGVVCF